MKVCLVTSRERVYINIISSKHMCMNIVSGMRTLSVVTGYNQKYPLPIVLKIYTIVHCFISIEDKKSWENCITTMTKIGGNKKPS